MPATRTIPEIGAYVVYGCDPRSKGFPLDPRLIATVRSYEEVRGVTYLEAAYMNEDTGTERMRLSHPVSEWTEILPFD